MHLLLLAAALACALVASLFAVPIWLTLAFLFVALALALWLRSDRLPFHLRTLPRLACAFLFAGALAACQTTSGGSANTAGFIAQVQAAIATTCKYAVPATDIAKVIAAGDGTVATVAQIVAAICPSGSSTTLAARRMPSSGVVTVQVNGKAVPVHYRRTD